jgi:hypothetical protein
MIYRTFLVALLLICLPLGAAAPQENYSSVNLNAGLYLSYNRITILVGSDELENSLTYPFLAMALEVELADFLTVGLIAGYNQNNFNEPVDFLNLPLSLRLKKKVNHSMIFGCNLQSEPVFWGDFSLKLQGEFLFFKLFKQQWDVELPIVEGSAEIANGFIQLSMNLLLVYNGMDSLTLYFGPQFNMISGTVEATESIGALQGEQSLEFKQKNPFGLSAGAVLAIGSHWDLALNISLLARTAMSIELFYIL